MREDFRAIWLIAGRELRDQFRDWRIIFPLAVLTFAFPFLMNEVAAQAVSFFARYGTTLIASRLIPFSILIIGFFPITISLVVALESFVGEKERGTIEPLLSAPLENWHLYLGKLLVGILTPLTASYISIGLYLVMVSRQHLEMPSPYSIVLLLLLTAAHALLMVSAAIVISIQSTSVRAANLLASFVVIPVAFMMQGESVLLFWGTDQVLWLAVAAVAIMAALLVRLGLAHFQREYLLGREFDTLDLRWMWRSFMDSFRGSSRSVTAWYRVQVRRALQRLATPVVIVGLIAVLGYAAAFTWTTRNIPLLLSAASPKELVKMVEGAPRTVGIPQVQGRVSPLWIFSNNLRATLLVFLGGLVSFSVLGMMAYLLNIGLVGGVLGMFSLGGYSPGLVFAAGLLPHGIFEIPALMLSSAAVLRLGAVLVTPQSRRSIGQVAIEQLADAAKVMLGVVVPLLALAAIIEAYVTPSILAATMR